MSSSYNVLKGIGVFVLIVLALTITVLNVGTEQGKVEAAVRAMGYQNVEAKSNMLVPCWGNKNRYGYRWTATNNGHRVSGEACSGGLFQHTVIKP